MPELDESARDILMATVQDNDLANIENKLYRPGATTGDGGTASMLTQEYYEGSSKHLAKAKERLTQLNNLTQTGKLDLNDLDIVDALKSDLETAIKLLEEDTNVQLLESIFSYCDGLKFAI